MKRRKAIGKAISMKKEERSDWRKEMGLEEAKKCNATAKELTVLSTVKSAALQ